MSPNLCDECVEKLTKREEFCGFCARCERELVPTDAPDPDRSTVNQKREGDQRKKMTRVTLADARELGWDDISETEFREAMGRGDYFSVRQCWSEDMEESAPFRVPPEIAEQERERFTAAKQQEDSRSDSLSPVEGEGGNNDTANPTDGVEERGPQILEGVEVGNDPQQKGETVVERQPVLPGHQKPAPEGRDRDGAYPDRGGSVRTDQARVLPDRGGPSCPVFPRDVMKGVAGDFARLYSTYLETPVEFWFWSFLTVLGSWIAKQVTLRGHLTVEPRLYTVLVAPTDAKKSQALTDTLRFFDGIGQGTLPVTYRARVCHGLGSVEGMKRLVGRNAKIDGSQFHYDRLLVCYDELRALIDKAKNEATGLTTAMNKLFESSGVLDFAVKESFTRIDDAAVSILGACTEDTYQKMFTPYLRQIGFINRLWPVTGEHRRKFYRPQEIPQVEVVRLQGRVRQILDWVFSGKRVIEQTSEADKILERWYLEEPASEYTKRLDTYGKRISVLLAVNLWRDRVDEELARDLLKILEWQEKVREHVDPMDADDRVTATEQKIRQQMRTRGPMTKPQIQKYTNARKLGLWAWDSAWKNLWRNGEIREIKSTGPTKYELVSETE